MDTCYLRRLYECCGIQCCEEIQQQELTLQDMQTRILPQQSLPLYRLRPAIKLLKKIRKILKITIHIHERDAHRQMRHQLQEQSIAGTTRTIWHHNKHNWCCRCHGPSCIYDQLLILNYISIRQNAFIVHMFRSQRILSLYICLVITYQTHLYVQSDFSLSTLGSLDYQDVERFSSGWNQTLLFCSRFVKIHLCNSWNYSV